MTRHRFPEPIAFEQLSEDEEDGSEWKVDATPADDLQVWIDFEKVDDGDVVVESHGPNTVIALPKHTPDPDDVIIRAVRVTGETDETTD